MPVESGGYPGDPLVKTGDMSAVLIGVQGLAQ